MMSLLDSEYDPAAGFEDVVGMTLEEAGVILRERGINRIRVMIKDGEQYFGTMEYRDDRINVSTFHGRIISVIGRN